VLHGLVPLAHGFNDLRNICCRHCAAAGRTLAGHAAAAAVHGLLRVAPRALLLSMQQLLLSLDHLLVVQLFSIVTLQQNRQHQ
jgi:hypothetical protein